MSTASGPLVTGHRPGKILPFGAAAVKFYKGAAAAIVLGTGFVTPLVPTNVLHVFVGVFGETYDNSGGTAGAYFTQILCDDNWSFSQTGTAITAANIGEPAFFADDNTVTLTPGTTFAGIIRAVDQNGTVWVDIEAAINPPLSNRNNILLSGAADAINPHVTANYEITTAGVDAATLAAPTAGTDDGVEIFVASGTANAHTITTVGLLQNGGVSVNTATFGAHPGASLWLRAYNAKWQVKASTAITFS